MYRVPTFLLFLICSAVPAFAGREFTPGPTEKTVDNELLVGLKPGTNAAAVFSTVVPAAVVKLLNQDLRIYQLRLPSGVQKLAAGQLAAHNLTEYVEPNRVR